FNFYVSPPMTGGTSCQSFATTTTAFETLDFFFAPPPAAGDITSCTRTFFAICSITEAGDITDVHFAHETASGIPTNTVFTLALQEFSTGQEINAIANVPDPDPDWTVGLAVVTALAVTAWRLAPLQLMSDRKE